MTRVWITRTLPGAQETAARVDALGYTPVVAPLLDVVATDVPPAPDDHDIAFTSPNGVRHYQGSKDTTAWCVGAATAKAARAAGFADIRVGPGDVDGLTRMLAEELERPLIHWAGAHVRGALAEELQAAGHDARRVTAYKAQAVEVSPLLEPVDVVLLHSPRAAEVFARLAPGMAKAAVAISSAANSSLATISGLERFTADTPDEVGMLAALGEAVYELGTMDDNLQTDTDMTEAVTPDPVPDFSIVERTPAVVRKGVGVPLVLAIGVLSALAGAGGGWALSKVDAPPVADTSTLRSDITGLRQAQASLVQQVGDLERGPDTSRLEGELSDLETRLAELEARPVVAATDIEPASPALDQLRTRLDALEDAQFEIGTPDDSQSPTRTSSPRPAFTPAMSRRFSELEDRLDALENSTPRSVPVPTPDISYSTDSTVAPSSTGSSATTAASASLVLPPFPRDAVEAALDRPDDASPAGRALRRFVRVRKVDTQEALSELDAAIRSGDTREALAAFSRLPEDARAAAPQWMALGNELADRKTSP